MHVRARVWLCLWMVVWLCGYGCGSVPVLLLLCCRASVYCWLCSPVAVLPGQCLLLAVCRRFCCWRHVGCMGVCAPVRECCAPMGGEGRMCAVLLCGCGWVLPSHGHHCMCARFFSSPQPPPHTHTSATFTHFMVAHHPEPYHCSPKPNLASATLNLPLPPPSVFELPSTPSSSPCLPRPS